MEHLLTRECPKGPFALIPERVSASGSGLTCMLWPVVTGHHVIALIRDYLQSLVSLIARDTKGWSLNEVFSTTQCCETSAQSAGGKPMVSSHAS